MKIPVIAKGDFGYHPASGEYLHQGAEYSIDEDAFSGVLFDRKPAAAPAAPENVDLGTSASVAPIAAAVVAPGPAPAQPAAVQEPATVTVNNEGGAA